MTATFGKIAEQILFTSSKIRLTGTHR